MTKKMFEVWAISTGGDCRLVAKFEEKELALMEAARVRWIYKSVFVDYGFYSVEEL